MNQLQEARKHLEICAQDLERGTRLSKELLDHIEAVDDRAHTEDGFHERCMQALVDNDEDEAMQFVLRIMKAGKENVEIFRELRDALDAALGGLQDMTAGTDLQNLL